MSEWRFHVEIPRICCALGRPEAEALLDALDGLGGGCGEPCARLRDELRRALTVREVAEPAPVKAEAEPEASPAVCGACGRDGHELPAEDGVGGALWVCWGAGCARNCRPMGRDEFEIVATKEAGNACQE